MITRHRGRSWGAAHLRATLVACVAALPLLVAACEKVPLLAPSGSTITLTASTSALPFHGTTQIIAQVIEPAGTPPHSGTHVIFTTTLGAIDPSEIETDVNGRAIATFNAGTASGIATITAASGGANVGANGAIKIAIGAAAVGSVAVDANPGTLPASGGASTITATVSDANGNALANVPVAFSTDAGSLSSSLVSTNQSGKAQTTLTTNKQAKVTAAAGVGSSSGTTTTPAPSGSVTVAVNGSTSITVGDPSPSAPVVGQSVTFSLSEATGGSPIQRTVVDYGDGRSDTFNGLPSAVTHAYSAAGTFVVRANATDTFGDTWVGVKSVTVGARPIPAVTINASANPSAGSTTTFTVSAAPGTGSTAAIKSLNVDFGDGTSVDLGSSSGTNIQVQHVYQTAGTYQVTATATDTNDATGKGVTVIVVGGAASASFTATPAASPAHTMTFDASASTGSSNITNYTWNFGDGSTGSGVTTTHTYSAAGVFTVTLTITDSTGRTATTSKSVTVP